MNAYEKSLLFLFLNKIYNRWYYNIIFKIYINIYEGTCSTCVVTVYELLYTQTVYRIRVVQVPGVPVTGHVW